jgi:hypothetical protein
MQSRLACYGIALATLFPVSVLRGGVSYRVTLNPDACHEIHLGRLSVPRYCGELIHDVNTSQCHYEIRTGGESALYLTVVCSDIRTCTAPQKYAVDLRHPDRVNRIDDTAWQAAIPLAGSGRGKGIFPTEGQRGVAYRGPLLVRSGPKWMGIGGGSLPETLLSASLSRAAVNSWDGYDVVHSALDPSFFWQRDKVVGRYWIDIYDARTAELLVAIEGGFKKIAPFKFQEKASWYSDRYYVMPLGPAMFASDFGMSRPLVCDVDAAARKQETGLKERK